MFALLTVLLFIIAPVNVLGVAFGGNIVFQTLFSPEGRALTLFQRGGFVLSGLLTVAISVALFVGIALPLMSM